ncbi:MAG TPA: putative selenium-dependent hydroxylase accessory protein YqeC [Syntrophomonadaceae bacterium]|jgi:probable selenium-dependent hydroxylase accessory protein YqeC|nr:putative selenium-dependent hydroxylase accessory protein YqeC [Syntrophomonadaceae bacterium]HHW29823.1 putative selenium-dependent hydroxylase accessory protein YqeC [Syntrophomonadaceae bacterium]
MELYEALQLTDKGMVAFVGGGGKSSLMLKLATECAQRDKRVLVTTSTKMFISQLESCGCLIIEQQIDRLLQEMERVLTECNIIAAASTVIEVNNKAVGFTAETLDKILKTGLFDFILVEADGARRLPLKAPRDGEPVLPSMATHVLAVTGIDVLNCPLTENHVMCCDLVAELAGQQLGTPVTAETIRSITSRYAYLTELMASRARFIPVINKADSTKLYQDAVKTAQLLLKDHEMVLITAALSQDPVKEVLMWSQQ